MAIAADDQDLESYYLSAWLLWSSGREEEAQDTYLQAVRSAPDNYSPYNEIGMHYMGRRDYEKAALWLTHACLHDAPAQTWKSLAHSYRHLGLKEDALKVLLYADKLDPYDPAIKRNIGWLLDDFGEQ